MKIVILDGKSLNPGDLSYENLNEFGCVTQYDYTETEEDTITRIGDAEIVLLNKVPITESILNACPNIKLICVQATGYNVIDCGACTKHGVTVCNVPSYGTASVAQFTMALLLELCHRIGLHDTLVHNGKWFTVSTFCFWDTPQMELAGKTIGIIGFGRIGQAVAKLASAFGMHVLANSRTEYPGFESIVKYVNQSTLFAESDIISLHCPLTDETSQIINSRNIAKMKDGVILLNTARGGLLNEQDVTDALISGKISGAAVDGLSQEPMRDDTPLLHAPNCIITPHMAWAPVESRQRLMDCVTDNIRAFLDGNPQNVVNR